VSKQLAEIFCDQNEFLALAIHVAGGKSVTDVAKRDGLYS
jgi:hypothetical protein